MLRPDVPRLARTDARGLVWAAREHGSKATTTATAFAFLRARAGVPHPYPVEPPRAERRTFVTPERSHTTHPATRAGWKLTKLEDRAERVCAALGLLTRDAALSRLQSRLYRAWLRAYPFPAGGLTMEAAAGNEPKLDVATTHVWRRHGSRSHTVAAWTVHVTVTHRALERVARGEDPAPGELITLDVDSRGRACWLVPGDGYTYRRAAHIESGWLVRGAHSTVSREDAARTARQREHAARHARQVEKVSKSTHRKLAAQWPALAEAGAPTPVLAAAHLEVTPEAVRAAGACEPGVRAFLNRYAYAGEPVALGAVYLAAPDARPWLERAAALVLNPSAPNT